MHRKERIGRGTADRCRSGAVERGGQVVAKLVPNATGETIKDFIKSIVNTDESALITDQYRGYNEIGKQMKHETINRSQQWEADGIHTNTMMPFGLIVFDRGFNRRRRSFTHILSRRTITYFVAPSQKCCVPYIPQPYSEASE